MPICEVHNTMYKTACPFCERDARYFEYVFEKITGFESVNYSDSYQRAHEYRTETNQIRVVHDRLTGQDWRER